MKIVYTTSSEAEGKMMQEILTNNGIESELKLSERGLEMLRLRFGGANTPGENWELLVSDSNEEKSKDLLP